MSIKNILLGSEHKMLERIHHFVTLIIRIVLLIAIATSILNGEWIILFISIITYLLTLLPKAIEKWYEIDIPIEFEILIVLFIYAAIFLGEVKGYYTKFWWWDAVLHTGSGIALGLIGFAIMLILYKENKIKAAPFTLALFSFSFSIAMGSVWEIFEFSMDQFMGTNMQKNGLIDTMGDLIVDSIGALFASAIGYFYIKTGQVLLFDRLINKFIKSNPKLFRRH